METTVEKVQQMTAAAVDHGYAQHYGVMRLGRVRTPVIANGSLVEAARYTSRASTMFQANDSSATVRRQKSGVLDPSRYTEMLTGGERVFQRRRAPKRVTRRVIMTLDMSGSMGGRTLIPCEGQRYAMTRYEHMGRLVVLMAALCRSQHVAFEVYGMDGNIMYTISVDDDVAELQDTLSRMSPSGGNADQYVIDSAVRMAWTRPESDVLIMHFSDGGFYVDHVMGDALANHYDMAGRLSEVKRVRLVGVGICDTNMARYGLDTISLECRSFRDDVDKMLVGLTDRLALGEEPQRPTSVAKQAIITHAGPQGRELMGRVQTERGR